MSTSVEGESRTAAAFFDLDKTIISRSSTLAFAPSFYRHGLITRPQALRGACAQLIFRLGGADHRRMERIRSQISQLCRGWPADRVGEIVTRYLEELIVPHLYAEALALLAGHREAGQDVIIVSTSGQEMVAPIGALLGASSVIATRMRVTDGCYTGEMDFYAYGEAKAGRLRELAAERGYWLPDCFAYSDSVTDLPMLEAVGHPHVVNPDRALRKIARQRLWPVLAFGGRSSASPAAAAEGRASRRQPGRSGHVNTAIDQDNELITLGSFQARRSVVERCHGPERPDTATGNPRATSRGRRAEPGESSETERR